MKKKKKNQANEMLAQTNNENEAWLPFWEINFPCGDSFCQCKLPIFVSLDVGIV